MNTSPSMLSIITINLNNALGLAKTLESVNRQTCMDFEHIVVDGASIDGSVEVLERMTCEGITRRWVSEPDSGIYNAMNKGVRMATGEYIQILNSGDCLAADDVVERMLAALEESGRPEILYGNMIKCFPDGSRRRDCCAKGNLSMLDFYHGTLNHDPAYIRRSLFERFGCYDEDMKICSDWKWYLSAVVFGGVVPVYADIDVTLFDMCGISENGGRNRDLIKSERRVELERAVPAAILKDYDRYAEDILMMKRIHRHLAIYRVVWFMDRVLFKIEKWMEK